MWPWSDKPVTLKESLFGKKTKDCKHDSIKLMLKMNKRVEKREEKMKKQFEKDLRRAKRSCRKDKGDSSDSSSSDSSSSDSSDSDSDDHDYDGDVQYELAKLEDRLHRDKRHGTRRRHYDVDDYDEDYGRDYARRNALGTRRNYGTRRKERVVKVVFPIVDAHSGKAVSHSSIRYEERHILEARAKKVMTEIRRTVDQLDRVTVQFSASSVVVTAHIVGGNATDIKRAIRTFSVDHVMAGYYRFKPPKESIL
jgi:hypothetical protein